MTRFQRELLEWYSRNGRALPWRATREPYQILLSELMLQQTRVATVVPRYLLWLERFPTVEALAAASEEQVVEEWAGLGYYSRARRLHEAARRVVAHGWPRGLAEWRALPGVGRYIAGALASIVGGDDAAAVDGNVIRVYTRLTADSGRNAEPMAWKWAESVLPCGRAADWNQALMELGATVCTPRNPDCAECPVRGHCEARSKGNVQAFPVRVAKQRPIPIKASVTAHVAEGHIGLRRVPKGKWWQGLREVPTELEPGHLSGHAIGTVSHSVTKHRIVAEVRINAGKPDDLEWHPLEHDPTGVSALSRKVIELVRSHLACETDPGKLTESGATTT